MADVTVNVGAVNVTQPFGAGYAVDGTQVEQITDDFTRQYPSSAQNNLHFNESSQRIQITSGPGGSAHFSWDEPGETDGDFVYTVDIVSGDTIELMICWDPDATKVDRGDGYGVWWDNTNVYIYEYNAGLQTTVATTPHSVDTTFYHVVKVTYTQSSGTIDFRAWRNDLSRPGSPDLTGTDTTHKTGKVGFSKYGGNSSWVDNLDITGDGFIGALTVAGYDPTVNAGTLVVQESIQNLTGGALSILGYDPVVGVVDIVYPVGTLEVTGYDPEVLAALEVTSGLGTLEVTGYDPVVSLGIEVLPGLGTLTITGYDPTVTATDSTTVDLHFKFKDSSGNVRSRKILEEDKIDHVNILSIGSNSHAQIDTHIASTADPHDVQASQVTTSTGSFGGILSGADDTTQKSLDTIDDLVVTYKQVVCLFNYEQKKARAAEWSIHGGLSSLDTGSALDSSPTDITVTAGIGKLMVVVNAGSDLAGDITVTGDTVDRNTGAVTAADTDTLTVDALTTDGSDTDAESNTRHSFTGAYLTSKWFSGSVTLSTTNLTLTDVDTYQVSFEQWNDEPTVEVLTLDVNALTTNVAAWGYGYLYSLVVTGDKCDITREVSLESPAAGTAADRYYRVRRGNLGISLDGTSDGFWLDFFPGPLNQTYWEDINIKVWGEMTKTAVLS